MRGMIARFWVIMYSVVFFTSCRNEEKKLKVIDYLMIDQNSYIEVSTVAEGLNVPWGMDYWEGKIVFTEITGAVKQIDLYSGELSTLLVLDNVYQKRTTGLLDIAIQKGKDKNPYVLLNYTSQHDSAIVSSLVRYTHFGDSLGQPKKLLTVSGYTGHNGARLVIDNEDIVYWATGDVADHTQAQDSTTLNGKILRLDLNGEIPEDNPIKDSYVYAWGFRNMQGLALDNRGNIFTSEHGDAIEDEINLINPLQNYGWPLLEGMHDTPEEQKLAQSKAFQQPMKSWTPVVAPAGLAFYSNENIPSWDNSLLLVTLKSQTFRVLNLNEERDEITGERIYFSDRYGRIRDVLVLGNGEIYLATSNRDWNPQPGFPSSSDDRILRLRPISEIPANEQYLVEDQPEVVDGKDGKELFKNYCSSCHKEDGLGVEGSFPPLQGSKRIASTSQFIGLLLKGSTGKEELNGVFYDQGMASFDFLKDSELSAIINYVNSEFGNGRLILTKEVTNYRKN